MQSAPIAIQIPPLPEIATTASEAELVGVETTNAHLQNTKTRSRDQHVERREMLGVCNQTIRNWIREEDLTATKSAQARTSTSRGNRSWT